MKEKIQIEEALLLHLTKGKSCKGCAYDGGGCLESLHEDVYTLIKSQSAQIESLTAQLAQKDSELAEVKNDYDILSSANTELFGALAQKDGEIAELKKKLDEAEHRIIVYESDEF